jgi:protein-S-isoprenylcysteine O-methyltransferase Ste14
MVTTATAPSVEPAPQRRISVWEHLLAWTIRLVLLWLIVEAARDPWQLLGSRTFPALVLFIASHVYWGIVGRNSAPAKTSESRASKWFHEIVLLLAFLLLFWPVPGLTGWFLPERFHFLVAAGAIMQAAFILLAVWARRHLGRNWSRTVRIGVHHELIRTGPYGFLRHPIYTAMLGMFLGAAISSSQYHALLGLGVLVVAYVRKTRLEEKILHQTFGAEYDAYRHHTWGLVPLVFQTLNTVTFL